MQVYATASATTAARTETFAYNTRGLLSSISDTATGGEQYRYEHDALGRVTTTQYAYLPFSYSLSQSYTAQGQLQQLSRTQGSTSDTFTYNYDSRSVLTGLSLYSEAITLDYNDALDLTSKAFANLSESRSYNNQGQMTTQGLSAGETQLEDFTLSYNAAFNLASLNSQTQGNRSYTYNPLDRLLTSTIYQYDIYNRRISKTIGGITQYFVWEDMQLTREYETNGTLIVNSNLNLTPFRIKLAA